MPKSGGKKALPLLISFLALLHTLSKIISRLVFGINGRIPLIMIIIIGILFSDANGYINVEISWTPSPLPFSVNEVANLVHNSLATSGFRLQIEQDTSLC